MTRDELYAVPPREFVTRRDTAVAEARAAGDAATAAELAKLRRPTVAAWLVNLLALRRPELLAGLAELARALQAAQRKLDGGQLRELTNQRRATVSALVATAASLAREADPAHAGAKLPLAEVESMLSAALTDAAVAESIRSGQLVRPVAPAGFGELPPVRLRLLEGGAGGAGGAARADRQPGAGAGREADDRADEEAVAAELAAARAAVAAAGAEQEWVAAAQREAKQALAQIDAELAELAARRAEAQQRLAGTDAASLAARRAVAAARRRLGEAEALAGE